MEYLGNKEILKNYKIGFLCSRKVPANIILKTYDWAIANRDKGVCIISGFHSKIEKDVFHFLLKGVQPLILVLARGLKQIWEPEIKVALGQKRLLVISPFPSEVKRVTSHTSVIRNKKIIELADELFIACVSKGGQIEKLNDLYKNKLNNTNELFNFNLKIIP